MIPDQVMYAKGHHIGMQNRAGPYALTWEEIRADFDFLVGGTGSDVPRNNF